MKRYKLLKDLPTFNKGDVFYLGVLGDLIREKDGYIVYAKPTLEKFNILDSDWFEEIPEGKRWRAESDGGYYWLTKSLMVAWKTEVGSVLDESMYAAGNYFKTEEEAQRTADWLKAFAVLRDDTKGFKPGWKDGGQLSWGVEYNYDTNRLSAYLTFGIQCGVLYFASRDDAEESIKAHERQWLTFFGMEE